MKTSLSVYRDLATISNNLLVYVLNSIFSELILALIVDIKNIELFLRGMDEILIFLIFLIRGRKAQILLESMSG
jgi:hypothetical protein